MASLLAAILGLCGHGCGNDEGPPRSSTIDAGLVTDARVQMQPDVGPAPVATVQIESLPALQAARRCIPSEAGQRVLTVDPEGFLWRTVPTTAGQTEIRILDGWRPTPADELILPFSSLQAVTVLGPKRAAVVAEGRLWSVADDIVFAVPTPFDVDSTASLCGDPRGRSLVLNAGQLYERDEDEWFEWTELDDVLSAARLLDRDGGCWGPGNEVWFGTLTGDVWSLTLGALNPVATLENSTGTALRAGRVVLADNAAVYELDEGEWQRRALFSEPVQLMEAAGSYAWLVVGSHVLRFDGELLERLDGFETEDIQRVYPHATGGLWVERSEEVCYVAPRGMLRIAGVRNGDRRTDDLWTLSATTSESSSGVVLTIDGQSVPPIRTSTGTATFEISLDVGWHRLILTSSTGQGRRDLDVQRLPIRTPSFVADILPIYEAHCSDSACHVPDSPSLAPDLSELAAWRQRSPAIWTRIVERGDMPPLASRNAEWSDAVVQTIRDWLASGMMP